MTFEDDVRARLEGMARAPEPSWDSVVAGARHARRVRATVAVIAVVVTIGTTAGLVGAANAPGRADDVADHATTTVAPATSVATSTTTTRVPVTHRSPYQGTGGGPGPAAEPTATTTLPSPNSVPVAGASDLTGMISFASDADANQLPITTLPAGAGLVLQAQLEGVDNRPFRVGDPTGNDGNIGIAVVCSHLGDRAPYFFVIARKGELLDPGFGTATDVATTASDAGQPRCEMDFVESADADYTQLSVRSRIANVPIAQITLTAAP
jgi:hypothetical protein